MLSIRHVRFHAAFTDTSRRCGVVIIIQIKINYNCVKIFIKHGGILQQCTASGYAKLPAFVKHAIK